MFQQPNPKRITRLKDSPRFGYITSYPLRTFPDRQPGEPVRIIAFCSQHCGATPDAVRVVTQSRREERDGEFFIGKFVFARQRCRRFVSVGIVTAAPLRCQNL